MTRLPPRSTRTCTLIPVPTLFRSAGDADVRNQRLPNVGATRHEVQHLTRHTGLEQQTHGTCGDQRCLWCRLGDDGVTRKQRRTDLADEDRQREVPRTDAREYATADELQFIALAGRPRQRQRREPRLCLFRVVTTDRKSTRLNSSP